MKVQDIIALANAGFTAHQIAQLDAAQGAVAQQVTETEPPETPAKPTEQTVDKTKEIPGQMTIGQIASPNNDPIAMLMNKLDTLTASVQAGAIQRSEQPPTQTVDEIVASIINPPAKDGTTK